MIIVILPYNNVATSINTKPVVLAMLGHYLFSKYKNYIKVISLYTSTPLTNITNLELLKCNHKKEYYHKIILFIQKDSSIKYLEIHQDTYLAIKLMKIFPTLKVSVVKHQKHLLKVLTEKIFFWKAYYSKYHLSKLYRIICVSEFLKKFIAKKYPSQKNKLIRIYNSYAHIKDYIVPYTPNEKKNVIIFVGKPNIAKGFEEFILAIENILPLYSQWEVCCILSSFSPKTKYAKLYQKLIKRPKIKNFIKDKKLVIYFDASSMKVMEYLRYSKIAVIPSLRKEEFGLVAIEAHLAGCAVITSGKGALKEISSYHALYLPKVTQEHIRNLIEVFINDNFLLQNLAKNGYYHVLDKFSPSYQVQNIDHLRREFI